MTESHLAERTPGIRYEHHYKKEHELFLVGNKAGSSISALTDGNGHQSERRGAENGCESWCRIGRLTPKMSIKS
ncbi:hypothetical protein AMECASPLE_017309 [Ameca splendens]|uniref:Uncharacterized protein n=1 Tax=Ameca splendens TaxID=208324 RepID=A0ABV0XR95_9TELE